MKTRTLLLIILALLAGCASLPDHGQRDRLAQSVLNDPQARILDLATLKKVTVLEGPLFQDYLAAVERNEVTPRYFASGDFNANGKPDAAFLAVKDKSPGRGTLVYFVIAERIGEGWKVDLLTELKNVQALDLWVQSGQLRYSWCYACDGIAGIAWRDGRYVGVP